MRTRVDSFHPSFSLCKPSGKNMSINWRLFCWRRLLVLDTRPVMLKDLAISVEKPSTSTPVTNATSMRSTFAWKARIPGRKAS